MQTTDSTIEVSPTSATLFPPVKPRLSKQKLLALLISTALVAGSAVIGIGYWVATSGKPLAQSQKQISPLDITNSAPIATIPLPPETSAPILIPDAPAPEPEVGMSTPAADPVKAAMVMPVSHQSQAATAPAPTPAAANESAAQTPIASQPAAGANSDVAALEARVVQLEKQLAALQKLLAKQPTQPRSPGVTAVSTVSIGDDNSIKPQRPVRVAPARRTVKPTVPAKPVTSSEPQVVLPLTHPEEQLVAIDYWGGKPSIVLRGRDGKVRFASEGDTIGAGRIAGVHAAAGAISLIRPDGSRDTLQIRESR